MPEPIEKDFQMRIDKDGEWYHEGGRIKRPALVALFSQVLSCDEAGQHWLRTPVEYGRIEVEDAAFVITKAEIRNSGAAAVITVTDNIERSFILSQDYPLFFKASPLAPHVIQPYIQLDNGVSAKLSRPVYYQLASYITDGEASITDGEVSISDGEAPGLWSSGTFFSFPLEEALPMDKA